MAAQAVVDWGRITTKLGLGKDTLAQLNAFRNRAAAARAAHAQFKEAKTTVDFEHYRAVLKNKEVVAEGEKLFKSFKPVDYDVQAQLKAIAAFENKAAASAKEAATKVQTELGNLNSTLKNIEDARPFEQLTVRIPSVSAPLRATLTLWMAQLDDVAKARPEITKAVETMVSKGKWTVPGYTEKFGNLSAI
ncbi:SPOSA6832_00997, partial [Sporobolomyces salmonicolor]